MPTNYTDLSSIKEHPFYQLSDKVAEICAPLDKFAINHFTYTFIHKDGGNGGISVLTSDKTWVSYFLKSNHVLLFDNKRVHSWSSSMTPKMMSKAAEYNHYNGVFIEKINPSYIETLEFASSNPYSCPLDFCYNKNLLNLFVLYFKDKARQLIKIAEKHPIYLPERRLPDNLLAQIQNVTYTPRDQSYNEFRQTIKTKKLPLRLKTQEAFLSHREFDILSLLVKGKTMREIAQILKISPRTVETYIYTAKDKTNTFTTSRLLDLFADSLF